ncbi:MAG TPA: gamma-glutamyltransferase [Gemmataceae bacterium]|nr:gamma-glutamyltransferase [Gemmataceae bacterium]
MPRAALLSVRRPLAALALLAAVVAGLAALCPLPPQEALADPRPKDEGHGMVVTVSPPAADVGLDVLRRGGNAVDAAVATELALAVTYPAAGNLGGGGFMVVFPGRGADPVVVEYRETAPAAASKTMFAKDDSWYGHKPVGVPGTVRGMALAHKRFGKLPWKDLVAPALKLAEEGFIIDASLAGQLNGVVASSAEFPELCRVYGKAGRADWAAGDRLVQKDLARTLKRVADNGADGFYKGPVADLIAEEMKAGGGLITKKDLEDYTANERRPVHGTYRGYDVYAPPPPSSGGTCLVEMLNILENFDLRKQGRYSPETLHLMIESMRRAYYDRALHLGDPAFTKVPAALTTKDYARTLARAIDPKKATRSEDLAKDIPLAREGDSTTHFSVIDRDGMAVANTTTLERSFGSRVVVKGAGFLLNDEMIDFNWRPGVTDRQGGIGTEPNLIAPGKRMLSSQTPTVVAKGGKVVLVTGSPGSRTIINTVLCVVVNVVDFDMDVRAAVDAPRLHHQWFPDEVRFEGTREYPEAVKKLKEMGHTVIGIRQGDAHTIRVDPKTGAYLGAEDRRIDGKVAAY